MTTKDKAELHLEFGSMYNHPTKGRIREIFYHAYGPEVFLAWLADAKDRGPIVESYRMQYESAPRPDIPAPTPGWSGPLEHCHVRFDDGERIEVYVHHMNAIHRPDFQQWLRSPERQAMATDGELMKIYL